MKKILLFLAALIASFALIAVPAPTYAKKCGGVEVRGECPGEIPADPTDGEQELKDTVKNVLSAIFGILGIIAAVVIIIAGVLYMISAGDPGKVATAKKAILYAVIGLIVALSAYAITNFILGAL